MNYWVEVLCDSGEFWGVACEGEHLGVVAREAMQNTLEHGYYPVRVESITDNDTGEAVYENGVSDWHPDFDAPASMFRPSKTNHKTAHNVRKTVNGQVKDTNTGSVYDRQDERFHDLEWPHHNIFL